MGTRRCHPNATTTTPYNDAMILDLCHPTIDQGAKLI
jgi:hypothetical protein